MVRHAVFVDLPNFYSHLVRSGVGKSGNPMGRRLLIYLDGRLK
jgi:hypothetical protein